MKDILTIIIILFSTGITYTQSLEELKKQKAEAEVKAIPVIAQADALKAEIDAINAKIATFPGWYSGAFGLVGADFLGRSNWFSAGELKDARSSSIRVSFNVFANKIDEKYFWRNAGSLNLGWQKIDKRISGEEPSSFEPIADVLNLSSLYGYNLTKNIAISALGEYRSSLLKYPDTSGVKISSFNNPGYLDLGIGFTLTPVRNLVFVLHPLNYNFIFSKNDAQFTSSLGCKLAGDYHTTYKGINLRSNISGFLSYKSNEPSLHNGTWTNWFGFNLFKNIGVGLEFGLRYSEQEITDIQNYYTLGLSYKL
ncbi:MAG: DUF3078 domain-containing protein [Saprospiraceae bacterium]|nr:DUF3078 domain-containing protein [Saprospiraceae bacterium]